ncbi:MAG: AAA family ATPase [Acidiferrobacterales bacterium]|nr:AAA family ATPase [Acidiferrobacterales bacterium]
MVFVGGPRQVGKTTLSLNIAPDGHRYLNWDDVEDREFVLTEKFPIESFVIFDEIHKFGNWRNYIKGFYDKHGDKKRILSTGSARLDYYRHCGDSLQGRYHYYRLHPLTVDELQIRSQSDFESLLTLCGFPEPFLSGSQQQARRWMREFRTRAVNEDIRDLELTQKLSSMELLLLRLPQWVGSPLSINALREDLNCAHKTVSNWLNIFERMYLIYRLSPLESPKIRAVRKERKHYHYNWAEIDDEEARFENLIASHILKWVHFIQDWTGRDVDLVYFRDIDGREVDLIITENKQPVCAIECKLRFRGVSKNLKYFKAKFPQCDAVQVHQFDLQEFTTKDGIHVVNWRRLLSDYGHQVMHTNSLTFS